MRTYGREFMRILAPHSRLRVMLLAITLFALAVLPAAAQAAKPARVSFAKSVASVDEGAGTYNLTITRSLNTRSTVTVNVAVDSVKTTAVAGTDYDFTNPGPITFNPGETRKSLPVTIHDDGTFNSPNKKVVFKLTAPGVQVKNSPLTLTILDNDGPGTIDFSSDSYSVVESAGVATITVSRTGNPLIPESIEYATSAGSATAGSDYTQSTGTLTFGIGEMSKTVDVPIVDDQSYELPNPETLQVTLDNATNLNSSDPSLQPNIGPNSPATLSIQDDDVPTFSFSSSTYAVNEPSTGTTTLDVTVNRGGATYVPADVVVSDLGTGSAAAGTDYVGFSPTTVHFDAGDTSKPFTVTVKHDGATTGNQTLDLGLALNGTQVDTAELSFVDHESTVPSVQFSHPTFSVNEAAGTASVTVSLAGPDAPGDVTVHYATSDDTATVAGGDYTATSGDLTIPQGQRSGTITVPIASDNVPEDDETFTVTLTSSDTNSILGSPDTAKVTIVDDDSPGTLEFSAQRYDVNETAGHATITVNRIGGSSGPVSVDYTTVDGTAKQPGDYGTTSGTLTFAGGETQKTFEIPVAWDGRQEGDETVTIQLSNFASDDDPSAVKAAVLHIADDGASGPVQFSAASYSVSERAGSATITVNRSGGSLGGPVTVDYAGTDGMHGTLTFGPGEASKAFQVPVVDDNVHTGARTVNLTLSNPGGGTSLGGQATAALSITDDEPASSPSTDKNAPKLAITAKKLQKALTAKKLVFKVRSNEAASLKITLKFRKGKTAQSKVVVVKRASKRVSAGKTVKVTLKLNNKALRTLRKALVKGKLKLTLSVKGTDAAKNSATVNKTVTIK
jgi:hypothetical protein